MFAVKIYVRGSEKALSLNLFQDFIHISELEGNYKTRNKKVEVLLNFLSIVD
ncbi:hypothetical protein HMPREF1142_0040 [Peptostreptococcaceae bacterium AS15]|nr:hypothetical protein HMPREF1142_0040 [Peptostreptococcaceae bacterium AS15]